MHLTAVFVVMISLLMFFIKVRCFLVVFWGGIFVLFLPKISIIVMGSKWSISIILKELYFQQKSENYNIKLLIKLECSL